MKVVRSTENLKQKKIYSSFYVWLFTLPHYSKHKIYAKLLCVFFFNTLTWLLAFKLTHEIGNGFPAWQQTACESIIWSIIFVLVLNLYCSILIQWSTMHWLRDCTIFQLQESYKNRKEIWYARTRLVWTDNFLTHLL